MMKSPATVPILLGISLLSVGGACVYAFLKKKKDELDQSASGDGLSKIAKLVRMISKEEIKLVEVTLSNKVIPLVIGRKGYTLKHIQESTSTEIFFRENDGESQICEIRGTEAGARAAQELIMKEASRQVTLTEEILVPQTACGKILGRCGDTLQDICRKSMAKVWIDGNRTLSETCRVMITGTQNQINVAKSLIEQKVKDDMDFRKTQEQLDFRREPRIRTPPTSATATPVPQPILPPCRVELLKPTSSSGQLEVFVSAVVSPSRFYLQLVGPQSAELDILVETMTEYYNQQDNRDLHRIRRPYLGQIVAAEFNADGKWYRAEVVAILPNEFKPDEVVLDLYFVDYGDNQYIQPSEVYELRPDFLALRFQAIECFLAHVEPNNIISATTGEADWDPSAVSRFEELTHVAQWKKLLSRITTYKNKAHRTGREGSPVPGVELYDTTSSGADIDIALELVHDGYARITNKPDLSLCAGLRLDGGAKSSSTDKLNDTNSSVSTTSSISSVVATKTDVRSPAGDINGSGTGDGNNISKTGAAKLISNEREIISHNTHAAGSNGVPEKVNDFLQTERTEKLTSNGSQNNSSSSSRPIHSRLTSRDWNELIEEEENAGGLQQ